MNVLVLHTQVPFTRGGAETLVEGLACALGERGHTVDTVSLPLSWNPVDELLTSAVAWSLLDLQSFNGVEVDLVICTKYPTWAARHPRKALWLIHQHRQAYDLHGTELSEFTPERESQQVRRQVMGIDRRGIGECHPRFAISRNVAKRLREFNGLDAAPLYPPVPRNGLAPHAYEPFMLVVSRLDNAKRVGVIVDAWRNVRSDMRLIVVGDGPSREELEKQVRRHGLAERVEIRGRVADADVVNLYNRCRGVVYVPVDEDYGYATVEALTAGKPVITAHDSGGVLEFVEHGVSGLVVAPDANAIAGAVDILSDEREARRLGSAGPGLTSDMTWDNVVTTLLGTHRDR